MKRYLETGNFAITEGAILAGLQILLRLSDYAGHRVGRGHEFAASPGERRLFAGRG